MKVFIGIVDPLETKEKDVNTLLAMSLREKAKVNI
jgi:hypothetical protein